MEGSAPHEECDFSLAATISRVEGLEKSVNDRWICTRRPDIYPFDTVAGEMLAKAFSICRAAITLIQRDYPDEAFGLCRSLYECSIYLRHITRDSENRNELSRNFLEFGVASKAFWFDLLEKSSTLTEEQRGDVIRYKDENKIPDDSKIMFRPWSGDQNLIRSASKSPHPIDPEDSSEVDRDKQRAVAYTDTSCYVHCTQPGLNTFSHEWKEAIHTKHPYAPSVNTAQKACMVIQVHLPEVIKYCFYGMQVESLDDLKSKKPLPHQLS
jgi:hypothetical protein